MNRFIFFVLSLLLVTDAFAQTPTQPMYVRQAKNPVVQVYDNGTAGSGVSAKIWDTSAFASAIVTFVRVSGACGVTYDTWEVPKLFGFLRFNTGSNISSVDIIVQLSPTATGTFVDGYSLQIPNGIRTFSGANSGTCVFDLYMTLLPFPSSVNIIGDRIDGAGVESEELFPSLIGGVDRSTSPNTVRMMSVDSSGRVQVVVAGPTGPYTSISPNDVTTVETVATMTTSVRATLQNNGTGAALCLVTTNNAASVDANTYSFSLAAATAVNDGTGGSTTMPAIPDATTYIRCAALSGTARISGYTHP